MEYFARHKLIALTILIQLIALPILLVLTREPQSSQGKAAPLTTISLLPATTLNSPQALQKGEYFSTNIVLEPGANVITQAKIEIIYDATKVELVKTLPISINSNVFLKTVNQPTLDSGKIELTLSIDNPARPITERVKVATIYFKALDNASRSYIYFGDNTKLIGINDTNVMQGVVPQVITISTASAQPQSTPFSTLRTTRTK